MSTATPVTRTASSTSAERTALRPGQKVELDGKLAKVVEYGFLQLPTAPGADVEFSKNVVATLQLPAAVPGGPIEYAYFVDPAKINIVRGSRLRALEKEFNALFGDPVPTDPAEAGPAPEIRQAGPAPKAKTTHSVPRGKDAPAEVESRPAIDLVHSPASEGKTVRTDETPARRSAKATPKTAKKSAAKKAAKKGRK